MTHARTAARPGPVDVILLGAGAIGCELIVQIGWGSVVSPLRICGLIVSSGYVFDQNGLSRRHRLQAVAQKSAGGKLASMNEGLAAPAGDALATTDDFRTGALAAVNLGDDADTTGAVYGQLAGAYYGASAIPEEWKARLTRRAEIETMAERLLTDGSGRS